MRRVEGSTLMVSDTVGRASPSHFLFVSFYLGVRFKFGTHKM